MRLDRNAATFIFIGVLQSIANYGIYLVVLLAAPWWIAFICATAVGITLQTVLQIYATFSKPLTIAVSRRYIAYQLAYTVVFAGLLSATIWVGVPPVLAPLVVLAFVTPGNFLLTRRIITGKPSGGAQNEKQHEAVAF